MATGSGRMVSERERLMVRSRPLAEAEATHYINWKTDPEDPEDASIRIVVSIHKCPLGYRSRLGYHATLFLTPNGEAEREIGYIIAWRISRPTGENPRISQRYWLDDWYHRISDTYNRDSGPLAACVWAFYGPGSAEGDSDNYDRVADEEKRAELRENGNEIVFIQTIYIKWSRDDASNYSNRCLASIYLENYYRILGSTILPAWFSVSGPVTYLLIPHLPTEAPVNELWLHQKTEKNWSDEETPGRVTDLLEAAFKGDSYKFKTYVDKANVFQSTIVSVLGRVVRPEDSISEVESWDRLLLPAVASSPAPSPAPSPVSTDA